MGTRKEIYGLKVMCLGFKLTGEGMINIVNITCSKII